MERPVGDRERTLGAQAEKLIRRRLTSPGFPRWRSCTERRASCRRHFPRLRVRGRVAFSLPLSRNKAILLRAAECQGTAEIVTAWYLRSACLRSASRARTPWFPAADPHRFSVPPTFDLSVADSSARPPTADPHNRRKRGISCSESEAKFMPKRPSLLESALQTVKFRHLPERWPRG